MIIRHNENLKRQERNEYILLVIQKGIFKTEKICEWKRHFNNFMAVSSTDFQMENLWLMCMIESLVSATPGEENRDKLSHRVSQPNGNMLVNGILLNNPFKIEEKCKLLHLQMEWSKMGSHSNVQILVIISQQLLKDLEDLSNQINMQQAQDPITSFEMMDKGLISYIKKSKKGK